ncbi:MAG: hotdog domain-containing protein [Desulfobacterales bacterium]|nr:hotdog domain-containing protein [Desulfobacterales bacterium]
MDITTHKKIDRNLCGKPLEIGEGLSRVELLLTDNMAADESGLVHGGFVFGLADYAAMIAVNHPNVVLGSADVKFLKPLKKGDTVVADARTENISGKKHTVRVTVEKNNIKVFEGAFICFVLDKHVLSA